MAASDVAGINAFNQSKSRRLNEEAAGRQEKRQVKQDERQEVLQGRDDVLFNRSTTLFEQQQKFREDELGLRKFGRDANTAIALFRSTSGQVFQPILDLYERIPDGGKFHEFKRNDDGTFDYEVVVAAPTCVKAISPMSSPLCSVIFRPIWMTTAQSIRSI